MNSNSAANRMFWKAWARDPRQTGALVPSGAVLARSMAAQVDPTAGPVLELGAGTGAITRALLDRGVAPDQLTLVEKAPALARVLEQMFPGIEVCCGDAADLGPIVHVAGRPRPATIVSSLPLLSMSRVRRELMLKEMFNCLEPNGRVIQFTYSPLPPISRSALGRIGVQGALTQRIARNLPPASVWTYVRQGDPQPR